MRNYIRDFPKFLKKIMNEQDLSKYDLNINKTQTNILMSVDENRNISMSKLSEIVGLEKSSFTRSVEHLVKNGFLTRKNLENDKRTINLSLTEKGTHAVRLIRKNLDNYLTVLSEILTEKEKKEFFEALKTVSKYFNKIYDKIE